MNNSIEMLTLRLCGTAIVQSAYMAAFGRKADVEGLAAYSHQLGRELSLQDFLSALLASDEHWQQLLTKRASEVVTSCYTALLGRLPDKEGLTEHVQRLNDGESMAEIMRGIGTSDEHQAYIAPFDRFATELIDALYRGILGRECDTEGVAAYAELLRTPETVADVATALIRSDEFYHRHAAAIGPRWLSDQAEPLANAVFRGLLQRDASDGERAGFKNEIFGVDDLQKAIASILNAGEFRGQVARTFADQWINAIFCALLNRPVDANGLASYKQKVEQPEDFEHVIRAVVRSREFEHSYLKSLPKPTTSLPWGARVDAMDALYRRYLGRPVDHMELAHHLQQNLGVGELHAKLLNEHGKPPAMARALIFGAYGNGNIGDAYQALAVREHLVSALGFRDEQIFACSTLKVADYPFPPDRKLPASAMADIDKINTFDYIFVGGGGLLSHPHDPLQDAAWVSKIDAPVIVLAAGASLHILDENRPLLERALTVAVRDLPSLNAVWPVRPEARRLADPILCLPNTDTLTAFDVPQQSWIDSIDVLWILKASANSQDEAILTEIRAVIDSSTAKHIVVSIEPALDAALDTQFPEIRHLSQLADLLGAINRAELVVSMRYHGAIFAALQGRRIAACSQSKIRDLLGDAGVPEGYIADAGELRDVIDRSGVLVDSAWLHECRTQFVNGMQELNLPLDHLTSTEQALPASVMETVG